MHSVHVHDFKPQAYFWQTNWKNGNCFAKVWAKQTAYKPQCQLRNPRKVYANHFLCATWRENQQIAHWRWLRRHWHGGRREDWQHQQWLLLDNPLTTRLSIILAWNRQCNMQINRIFAHFNCTQTGPESRESCDANECDNIPCVMVFWTKTVTTKRPAYSLTCSIS